MNRPISLTAERNLGSYQSQQYAGCMIDSYDLTLPTTNAAASFKANVSAASVAILGTPSAIGTLTDPGVPFVFAEGALSVFGQSLNNVTNVKFTLNNGVKENWTVAASHLPTYITPTTRLLSGELTTVFYSLNDTNYGFFNNWMPNLSTPVPGAINLTLAHPLHLVTVCFRREDRDRVEGWRYHHANALLQGSVQLDERVFDDFVRNERDLVRAVLKATSDP